MRGIAGTLMRRVPADMFNFEREEGVQAHGFQAAS